MPLKHSHAQLLPLKAISSLQTKTSRLNRMCSYRLVQIGIVITSRCEVFGGSFARCKQAFEAKKRRRRRTMPSVGEKGHSVSLPRLSFEQEKAGDAMREKISSGCRQIALDSNLLTVNTQARRGLKETSEEPRKSKNRNSGEKGRRPDDNDDGQKKNRSKKGGEHHASNQAQTLLEDLQGGRGAPRDRRLHRQRSGLRSAPAQLAKER